jgi:hypothetical protein
MPFNLKNYYKKVTAIQAVYDIHARIGLTNEEIYRRYIRDVFFVSRSTFYKYITISIPKDFKPKNNGKETNT